MFSYKAYTEMEKDGINVKVYASFDAMKKSNITPIDPSSAGITYNNTMHKEWTRMSTDSYTIAFGAAPISANNDPETWQRLVIDVSATNNFHCCYIHSPGEHIPNPYMNVKRIHH